MEAILDTASGEDDKVMKMLSDLYNDEKIDNCVYERLLDKYMKLKHSTLMFHVEGRKVQTQTDRVKSEFQQSIFQLKNMEQSKEQSKETIDELKRNLEDGKDKIEQCEARNVILMANVRNLEGKVHTNSELLEKLESFYRTDLKKKEESLQDSIAQFKREIVRRMASKNKISAEMAKIDGKIAEQGETIDALQAKGEVLKKKEAAAAAEKEKNCADFSRSEVNRLKQQVKKLQKLSTHLQETLNHQQSEKMSLQKQAEESYLTTKRLQVRLKRSIADDEVIQQNIKAVQSEMVSLDTDSNALRGEIENISAKISMARQTHTTLKSTNKILSTNLARRQSDIQKLGEDVAHVESVEMRTAELVTSLRYRMAKAQGQRKTLEETTKKQEKDLREKGKISVGVDTHLSAVRDRERLLGEEIATLKQVRERLLTSQVDLERVIQDANDKACKFAGRAADQTLLIAIKEKDLQNESLWIRNLAERCTATSIANGVLEASSCKIQAALLKAEELTEGLAEVQRKSVASLRRQEKIFWEKDDILGKERKRNNILERNTDEVVARKADTLLTLQAKRDFTEGLIHEIAKSKAGLDHLNSEIELMERENSYYHKEVEETVRQAISLEEEISEMESHRNVMKGEVSASHLACVSLEDQKRVLEIALADIRVNCGNGNSRNDVDTFSGDIRDLNIAIEKKNVQLRAATEKRRNLEVSTKDLSKVREQHEVIHREADELQSRLTLLKERLNKLRAKYSDGQEKMDILAKDIKSVQTSIQETMPKAFITRNLSTKQKLQIADEDQRLKSLIAELSILQATLDALRRRRTRLEDLIEATASEIEMGNDPPYEAIAECKIDMKSYNDVGKAKRRTNESENVRENDGFRVLADGTRTTADVRPNSYTPDAFSMPIPFRSGPLKPTHFKK